jgi:hypothetical protein
LKILHVGHFAGIFPKRQLSTVAYGPIHSLTRVSCKTAQIHSPDCFNLQNVNLARAGWNSSEEFQLSHCASVEFHATLLNHSADRNAA